METFLDMDFERHRAIGLVWLDVALQLATTCTPLMPYNVTDYAVFMENSGSEFAQLNQKSYWSTT